MGCRVGLHAGGIRTACARTASHFSSKMQPCSTAIFSRGKPARWSRPSTFCVTRKRSFSRRASSTSARCVSVGRAVVKSILPAPGAGAGAGVCAGVGAGVSVAAELVPPALVALAGSAPAVASALTSAASALASFAARVAVAEAAVAARAATLVAS